MPIVTTGFAGSIDDITFSQMEADRGPRFTVAQYAHWRPTVTAADRTVSLAAGWATQLGLRHVLASAETYQTSANTSGLSRLDLLCLRADFSARTAAIVWRTGAPGSGTPPALTRSGNIYESPICVARIDNGMGAIPGAQLWDTRLWGGGGGPLRYSEATPYLDVHDLHRGAEILVESATPGASLRYRVNDAGVLVPTGMWVKTFQTQDSINASPGNTSGQVWYRWPAGQFASVVIAGIRAGDQIECSMRGEIRSNSGGKCSFAPRLSGVTASDGNASDFNLSASTRSDQFSGESTGTVVWNVTAGGTATIEPYRSVEYGAGTGSWAGCTLQARVVRA